MQLSLDHTHFLLDGTRPDLSSAQAAYTTVQDAKSAGQLGFTHLLHQEVEEILTLAAQLRGNCQNLVVIGIGGSDLGARAVHRALNHQFFNLLDSVRHGAPRLFFLGDTTDPVAVQEVLEAIELEHTTFVVISKSGNTVEQMSTFTFIRQLLLDRLGTDGARERIVILTDAAGGTLREIVNREGYRSLPIPSQVGGRFSVFSSVGLFPLAVAGIDIQGLHKGAATLDIHDSEHSAESNLALAYATLQIAAYRAGKPISVLMPYTYSLREVGFWFRQLWAESLGKKLDRDGREVWVGPTPIAAVGPTDQHSQLQLYMEGPADKVMTFIEVSHPRSDLTLPEAFPDLEGVRYLAGHTFGEILRAERTSTAYALAAEGRPSVTITLSELTAESLGALLYFFELATTYAGELLAINAFDQPGVEVSKNYMYGLLGRPGYEQYQIKTPEHSFVIKM